MSGRIIKCSFDEYRSIEAANAHGLMLLERSPAHYLHARRNPHEPTPAQTLGTLVHLAILEPLEFEDRVIVPPDFNKRTKQGRVDHEAWRSNLSPETIVATDDQVRQALVMRKAVMAQPFASTLLADGEAEQTMLWVDTETGVECKARADWICGSHAALPDIKTTRDASYEKFRRDAANFRYHLQASWYQQGAEACGLGERDFVFIVVEVDPPHGVALYQLSPQSLHIGYERSREALIRYAECLRTNEYPGYPREIQNLDLPSWAM